MVELLAPAGDLEKLKYALIYGADAVYLGGESFGLRKASKNFSIEQIEEGVQFAHGLGKKVYVTLNIIPHDKDMEGLEDYVKALDKAGVDAFIVADPGMFLRIRAVSKTDIHISTQASLTNTDTVRFWQQMGAKRVVLARELSLQEIKAISNALGDDLEIECFVHGAMCMSYSGRCLLSNYMTGRDANMGDCAHACRYKYALMEEKRPGEFFPVYEDEQGGTFIMNSKDLCMIEHIPKMLEAGISSFKIEGRVKSLYYVANIVHAYRKAIDSYLQNPEAYIFQEKWMQEIKKAGYRNFTTGFYFGRNTENAQMYDSTNSIKTYDFVGIVKEFKEENMLAELEQRNRIFVGDVLEAMIPGGDSEMITVDKMYNEKMEDISVAAKAQQTLYLKTGKKLPPYTILRKQL